MAFKDIFKDKNEFNEKTIIGFMSFAVMTMYSITDLITGYMGMELPINCLLYTSPSPRDRTRSRMPSSA